MPERHFRQTRVTYSASGPFPKNKERTKNLLKQEIQDKKNGQSFLSERHRFRRFSRFIYHSSKYLIEHDKAFNITKNTRYDGHSTWTCFNFL